MQEGQFGQQRDTGEPASPVSVESCLHRSDPLDDAVADYLLSYREEDGCVDFKLDFDQTEREWLELTKDVLAFTNTRGGYLVFGVRDGTFQLEGLDHGLVSVLTDTNKILQKLNRFVEPRLTGLRTKSFERDGTQCVVWFLPESRDQTHVVAKDASFTYRSGASKVALRQGTVWVRGSAGNRIADSDDLGAIFERRLSRYRGDLLANISRVVEAPPDSHVVVLSEDPQASDGAAGFIISDAPDALEVKGLAFSVEPKTHEQELAAWIAMSARNESLLPPPDRLWAWYAERSDVRFSLDQRLVLARWCLLSEVPAFYWIKDAAASEAKTVVREAAKHDRAVRNLSRIVGTASFLGSRFHRSILRSLSRFESRLPTRHRKTPCASPPDLMGAGSIAGLATSTNKPSTATMRRNLNRIAGEARDSKREPPAIKRSQAIALDCLLYARGDKYSGTTSGTLH